MRALKFNSFPAAWPTKYDAGSSRDISPSYPTLNDDTGISSFEAIKKALAKKNIADKPAKAAKAETVISQQPKTAFTKPRYSRPVIFETVQARIKRIKSELIRSGVTLYGLHKAESRILPKMIRSDESIMAVIYGRQQSSSIMVVATDKRIISLDKKPMALLMDEFSYEVIAGLEFEIHTLFATLILHTPVKKYDIRYVNLRCADRFVRYVETQRIHSIRKQEEKATPQEPPVLESPLVLYPRHAANLEIEPGIEIDQEREDETYYYNHLPNV